MKEQRFTFRQDNDAHWYLVEVEKAMAFNDWLEAMDEDGILPDDYDGFVFDDNRTSCPEHFTFSHPVNPTEID